MTQQMSDTLQLVVIVPNAQARRNVWSEICFRNSWELECLGRDRQAEAYRTFVECLQP